MANKKEIRKIRLATKVILTVSTFAVIISVSLFVIMRFWMIPSLQSEIRNRLLAYSTIAASLIDGDAEQRILANKLTDKSAEYLSIKTMLTKIMEASPQIHSMYTMEETKDPNVVLFAVDVVADTKDREGSGESKADETPAEIGEKYDVSGMPTMRRGFVEPSVESQFYTDKWGTTLSAYAPIKNSKGEIVGLVGTDMSYEEVLAQQKDIMNRFYIYIGVFIFVIITFAFLLASMIVKGVGDLNKSVVEISSEGATGLLNDEGGDEMAELSKSINRLVIGLRKSKDDSDLLVADKTKHLEEKLEELEKMNKLMIGREIKMYELKKELREVKNGQK